MGRAHSTFLETITIKEVTPILRANIAREASLMTDASPLYKRVGKGFADHRAVHHGRDGYVRAGTAQITTNTVEGYFSILKRGVRGMRGVNQHCGEKHLNRYMAEFDFRYSNRVALGVNDLERAEIALQGVVGKR
ncbi:MAG: hypothetical protein EON59_06215 [Alphaproteobacteria bacterium]|nr:MAG: hypothetical protein EON59_06215 [Alphaproteobacteria bacterium]